MWAAMFENPERPAVSVFVSGQAPEWAVESVLFGLEEEGIPGVVIEENGNTAVNLAKRAADGSMLGVGVSLVGKTEVVLHHRDLPMESPLFDLKAGEISEANLRRLGGNAARLVKSEPLRLGEAPDVEPEPFAPPPPQSDPKIGDARTSDREAIISALAEIAEGIIKSGKVGKTL